MKRALAIALAIAVLVSLPSSAHAADWRPVSAPGDRLAALDAEMAPLLVQHLPAQQAIADDFTVLSTPYSFEGVAAAAGQMQARVEAAERLPADIAVALTLAHDALAVLDRHPAEACWADYAAVLRTGWLAFGDSADALMVGAMSDANRYIGIALHLLGPWGDLVHGQAVEDCGA